MKRTPCVLLALAATVLALAGCGEKQETVQPATAQQQPLNVMLDWFPNADHVGLYQGLAEGDFARAGLKVNVETPSDPSLPLKLVAAGKVDLALSYEPELLLARNEDQNLVSIAAVVQEPLTSIVSVGAKHITSPAQLRGKRVGDAGIPYQHAFLQTILAQAGVPAGAVHTVNVGENLVPAMLSGRVDATIGAYWNYEAIQLEQLHQHPNVIRVDQAGVPTYDELVLVANQNTIYKKANQIRAFVQALGRGYASARRDPQTAVANLVKANPSLDPTFQTAAVRASLPAFFPAQAGKPWGWQDAGQWAAFGRWMMGAHLITNPSALTQAQSNDFLAGVGP